MLKKIKQILIVIILLLVLIPIPKVNAKEQLNLYLFWGDGCPHCALEKEYLEDLKKEYKELNVIQYEVWYNEENNSFLKQIADKTNKSLTGVPVTIIGQTIITGFKESTEQQMKRAIDYYLENDYQDIVEEIKNGTYEQQEELPDQDFVEQEEKLDKETTVDLPIIKKINFKDFDLLTAIPILGVLASLSLPVLWLIITYFSSINLEKDRKTKIILLPVGLLLIGIFSIIQSMLQIELINMVSRIIIIILCITFMIHKLEKINLKKSQLTGLILLLSIAIGLASQTNYWQIANTLIEVEKLSLLPQLALNIYYLIAYLSPLILLSLLFIPWRKISPKNQELIELSIWTASILVIIFI